MLAPSLVCAQAQQTQQNQQASQTQPQKTQQLTNCRALDSAGGFIASDEVLVDGMVCKLTKPKKVVFVPEVPQGSSGNSTTTPSAKTIDVSASDQPAVQLTGQSGSLADVARSYGKTSNILGAPKGKTEAPIVRPGASMGEIARAYKGEATAPANGVPESTKTETAIATVPKQDLSVAEAARAYGKVSPVMVAPKAANSESGQPAPPDVPPGASVAEIARAYKKANQPQLISIKGSAASRLLTRPEKNEPGSLSPGAMEANVATESASPAVATNSMMAKEVAQPSKEIPTAVSAAAAAKVEQPSVAKTVVPSEPALRKSATPRAVTATVASALQPTGQPLPAIAPTVVPEPVRASEPAARAEVRVEPAVSTPAPVVAKTVPRTAAEVAPEPVEVVEAPPKPVLKTDFAKPEARVARRVAARAPSIGIASQNGASALTSAAVSSGVGSPEPPPAEPVAPVEAKAAETAESPVTQNNETVPEVVLSSAPTEPSKESQMVTDRPPAVEPAASAPPEPEKVEAVPAANAEPVAPAATQAEVPAEAVPAPVARDPGEVKSSGFDSARTATVEARPETAAEPNSTSTAMEAAPAPAAPAQPEVNAGSFAQPDATPTAAEKTVVQGAMPTTIDDSAEARPEVQTGSFGTPDIPVVEARPEKPIDPFEHGESLDDLSSDTPHPGCSKIVSLGSLEKDRLILTIPTWVIQWAAKNQKKFPGICFADAPVPGLRSFLVVFFTTAMPVAGVAASNAPVAGGSDSVLQKPSGGTFSTTFGSTWHYTEDNAATTTVTTALQDGLPKNWGTDTQFAIAYSEQGTAVSQHFPGPLKKKEMEILTAKPGGKHDPSVIEARRLGDLLTAILQDIANH